MKYILAILILIFFGCNKNKIVSITTSEICECYSKSKETNIDIKLNNCTDFKTVVNNADTLEFQKKITNSVINLIKECPEYQDDFNLILINKFETPSPLLISQNDSILKCINSKIDLAKNYSKLAEIAIQKKEFQQAMTHIETAQLLDKSNEYMHWIKAYLFQKKNDFDNAIKEFEYINLTADKDSKAFNNLMIENLRVEKLKLK
jgi:tetratricopeptide (TPR) repeat protein